MGFEIPTKVLLQVDGASKWRNIGRGVENMEPRTKIHENIPKGVEVAAIGSLFFIHCHLKIVYLNIYDYMIIWAGPLRSNSGKLNGGL